MVGLPLFIAWSIRSPSHYIMAGKVVGLTHCRFLPYVYPFQKNKMAFIKGEVEQDGLPLSYLHYFGIDLRIFQKVTTLTY